jgi:hypothetical protein
LFDTGAAISFSGGLPKKKPTIFNNRDAATSMKNEGGLGAILCQADKRGNNREIAYASRQLLKHEKIARHL